MNAHIYVEENERRAVQKTFLKNFKKGVDKWGDMQYNSSCAAEESGQTKTTKNQRESAKDLEN